MAASMPVGKDEPLIGVMWTELLFPGELEAADEPGREMAALQLGYKLLKETALRIN